MYLDDYAQAIRRHVPEDRIPDGEAGGLFRWYAVLLLAKGADVTEEDVHNAWSAWMAERDGDHAALVPFSELGADVAEQDAVFRDAIKLAARETGHTTFHDILFPAGVPQGQEDRAQVFNLYKMMVDSSEALVGRRQAVNTFFLTMNGALLTASGLLVQNSDNARLGALGVMILALAGLLLSLAWRSLINSFGQLNTGKFKVINTIERHLDLAIYAAEWEALGRGEDPDVYRSFTSREIWAPNALASLHGITMVVGFFIALGVIKV